MNLLIDCFRAPFIDDHSHVMAALGKPFDLSPNVSVTLVKGWESQYDIENNGLLKHGRNVYVYPIFSLKSPPSTVFEWDHSIVWLKKRLNKEGNGISLEDGPDGFSNKNAFEHSRIIAQYCFDAFEKLFAFRPSNRDACTYRGGYATLYYDQSPLFSCCERRKNRLWVRLIQSPGLVNDLENNYEETCYDPNYKFLGASMVRNPKPLCFFPESGNKESENGEEF